MDIKEKVKQILLAQMDCAFDEDPELDDDTDLFDAGLLDSMDAVTVLSILEEELGVQFSDRDLMLYPMNSINEIAWVVEQKLK